jgi:hypothetical protein
MTEMQQLVTDLNLLGIERMDLLDKLWENERQSSAKRRRLVAMLDHGLKDV